MMGWHKVLGLAAITSFGLALIDSNAIAQQKPLKEQLVGAWMVVRCEVVQPDGTKGPLEVGSNPLGQFIFNDNGRFAFQVAAEIPKIASGDDKKTTPEEDRAVAQGSIAYFGSYTVTDADKTIHLH